MRERTKQTHRDVHRWEPIRPQGGSGGFSFWQGLRLCSLGNSVPSLLFHEMIWILISHLHFFHLHENEFISIICNVNNLKKLKDLTGQRKMYELYFISSGDSIQPVSQWAAPKPWLKGNIEIYLTQHLAHMWKPLDKVKRGLNHVNDIMLQQRRGRQWEKTVDRSYQSSWQLNDLFFRKWWLGASISSK